MLQLNLNFLGKHLERFRPPRSVSPESAKSVTWKHGLTVHLVRPPRARRYLLRLQADGSVRLVIPRRGSRAEGLQFLERSEAWLFKQKAQWQQRHQARQPWVDGVRFLFRGEDATLCVENFHGSIRLHFSDQLIPLPLALPDYRELVLSHLRRLAERELPIRTHELARQHGITIHRVTVRAQKTRWGSCSARGTISLNWRLIQAPPEVSDYLIIHELMHRREMNHSSRYWKLVEEACPDYRVAEKWLKKVRLDRDYLPEAAPA
jgi:predicted metal-dependent hydrolase